MHRAEREKSTLPADSVSQTGNTTSGRHVAPTSSTSAKIDSSQGTSKPQLKGFAATVALCAASWITKAAKDKWIYSQALPQCNAEGFSPKPLRGL